MKKSKQRGILIKQIEYGDSSIVLRVLCREHGMIGIIAKGIRKQTEKHQLTNLCEYELGLYEPKESGLWLLYEHSIVKDFSHFPTSATWVAAECGLELISNMIVPAYEHAHLYELTISYLNYLQNVSANAVLIFWRFFIRLLRLSGIGSPLDECCVCHNALKSFTVIDQQSSGLVCESCLHDIPSAEHLLYLSPISSEILRLMPEIGLHLTILSPCKRELNEINGLLERYWDSHNKQTLKLKSLSVLSQFYL